MELEPKPQEAIAPEPQFAEPLKPELLELAPPQRLELLHPAEPDFLEVQSPIESAADSIHLDELEPVDVIDVEEISDLDRRPARIHVGLSFVGAGALSLVLLILYLNTFYPGLSSADRIEMVWYQFILFICLGVAGLFMLGREAMRPDAETEDEG